MLITLLILVAIFFIARGLLLRYGGKAAASNAIAGAIVLAFLAGFFTNAVFFTDHQGPVAAAPPAAVPAPAPPATTLPGKAVSPSDQSMSQAAVDRLASGGPPTAYAVVESLGGAGPDGNQFPVGSPILVHGWAGDPTTKSTAAGLLFIVDGKRRLNATGGYGVDRLDVATAFGTLAMLHSNVATELPTKGLAKGTHSLELAAIDRDGRHYRIVLVPPKSFVLQ
jgi:hypothetical protein